MLSISTLLVLQLLAGASLAEERQLFSIQAQLQLITPVAHDESGHRPPTAGHRSVLEAVSVTNQSEGTSADNEITVRAVLQRRVELTKAKAEQHTGLTLQAVLQRGSGGCSPDRIFAHGFEP